ncbi:MAG: hypothetical protein ACLQG3_04200 [Terracidiphilus sp.]
MANLRRQDKVVVFEKRREKWTRARSHGKLHFILLRGVLWWSGFMFLFMTAFSVSVIQAPFGWRLLIVEVVVWPIAGYFYGLWVWHLMESKYGPKSRNPYSIAEG